MKTKNQKIKNKHYRNFLDNGIIDTLSEDHILKALENVSGKRITEARSLIITLYYTGARPIEVLNIRAKDVTRDGVFLAVKVPASKNGLPRTLYLPRKKPLIKELWEYSSSVFPEMLLFYHFRSRYMRSRKDKSGKIRHYLEITDSLRYWVNKWFEGVVEDTIPPYFLRHNRFSKLAEQGIDQNSMRTWKGAKTFESILAYQHLSTFSSKKIGRKID